MILVDEYLTVRVLLGAWPDGLPDDDLVLPASRHWRLLQALHGPRGGQLSRLLEQLSPAGRDSLRHPHPEVLQVLDPRPLLDEAAAIAARYGGTGLLIAESLAAGLHHGSLWFGTRSALSFPSADHGDSDKDGERSGSHKSSRRAAGTRKIPPRRSHGETSHA